MPSSTTYASRHGMFRSGLLLAAAVVCSLLSVAAAISSDYPTIKCDIVVLGGSTASLAAGIAAAEAAPDYSVCLTEITDWPGGQLTAAGVSAIDFGPWNHFLPNLQRTFADLVNWTQQVHSGCWVSYHCFTPDWLMNTWIFPKIASLPNLYYYPMTVATAVEVESGFGSSTDDRRIRKVRCVTRVPRNNISNPWDYPLSDTLDDWYSLEDTALFTKTVFDFEGKVFIDASIVGDVLVNSGANFTQGAEYPHETSTTADPSCGLAATLVYFMKAGLRGSSSSGQGNCVQHPPAGNDEGIPFPFQQWAQDGQWRMSWTYRRGVCNSTTTCGMFDINPGDVTQQNWINDLDSAYLLLPMLSGNESYPIQRPWRGGVNQTVLKMLEDRAYASYHFLKATFNATLPDSPLTFELDCQSTGTSTGLSKLSYARDSRRAFGLDGFRFLYAHQDFYNASYPYTGYQFHDTVALGDYFYADMHKLTTCNLPQYQWKNETKPYYIPFRSLTVDKYENFLVAGRQMAESFHANAASREHPVEWAVGAAAGGAAAFMRLHNIHSTREVYENHIEALKHFLVSVVGQPLAWTPPGPLPPLQLGFGCVPQLSNRCIGLTAPVAEAFNISVFFNHSSCDSTCLPLSADEWVAPANQWNLNSTTGVLTAPWPTMLGKSFATPITLPPSEKMSVAGGSSCQVVGEAPYTAVQGMFLCKWIQ
jgi:hypothetical protein